MNKTENESPSTVSFWKKHRRWIIVAVGVVAAAALLYAAYRPRPMRVEVATVSTGLFEQVIEENGRLRLKERYLITAPTPAQLQRPTLKVGDAVRAGDVLVTLEPVAPQMIDARTRSVLQQRVGSADAARRAAAAQAQRQQTALAQATLEAERATKLAQDNFISSSARDQALLARQSAQQAVGAARAELNAADYMLAEAQAALGRAEPTGGAASKGLWSLKSPVNGLVIKLHQDSAGPVVAGQPLMEIGDTASMEAVVDVLSGEVRQIQPGAPVQLSAGIGAPALNGRVLRVEPVAFTKVSALGIEEQRVNVVVVVVAVAAPASSASSAQRLGTLGDGFRVDARITLSSEPRALRVPTAALVRDGAQWRVFVVEGGRAVARAVKLQDRNADQAWVQSGLRDGETVLLYPGSTITDRQPVRVREATK